MREKSKKETITREILERELVLQKQKYIDRHFKRTVPYFLILFLFFLFFTMIIGSNVSNNFVLLVIMCLLGLSSLLVTVFVIRDYIGLKKALEQKLYYITIDRVKIKDVTKRQISIIHEEFSFHFVKNGYTNNLGTGYFNSSEEGVYGNAALDDKFYLIMYKKQILCIYNMKFYELDDELQKELRN